MDYGKLTLEELKKGYHYNKEKDTYICNYCEQSFPSGQIFQIEDNFYVAEYAAARHINAKHDSNLSQLIRDDSKYNTLTDIQKDLLLCFHSGMADKEIAKKMNVSESTIRRQRFTFREKAKQAKFYLAIYEQIFRDKQAPDTQIVPVHNNAVCLDDRYLTTEQEKQRITETFFSSLNPLVLKTFTTKEKNKLIILRKIADQFEPEKQYSEKEVTQILKQIFDDYSTLRRYLIMYGFMKRTKSGDKYWRAD